GECHRHAGMAWQGAMGGQAHQGGQGLWRQTQGALAQAGRAMALEPVMPKRLHATRRRSWSRVLLACAACCVACTQRSDAPAPMAPNASAAPVPAALAPAPGPAEPTSGQDADLAKAPTTPVEVAKQVFVALRAA